MSAQHLTTPDRLRHLRAMGLQPLLLRGGEQEPAPVPEPVPATPAASAQNIPKAATGQGDGAVRTSPAQQAAAQASTTPAADVRDTAVEGPRLRLWFADAQADALNGPHRRLLQDVLRSVGAMPEQVLVMEADGSASTPTAPLTPALSPARGGEGVTAESAASPSRSNATAAIASAPSPASPPAAASAPIAPVSSPASPLEAASAPSPPRAGERVGVRGQTSNPVELPILAFGTGAPAGSTRVAALARLRDPLEKRIAWPMLRALRRRLQGGS